ncbi:hypothetical protein GOV07_02115 [Candidatus Woesearchaeota archaeon]|nr:hypothetical protein [Candidatus Woesearchaeota archaeon]
MFAGKPVRVFVKRQAKETLNTLNDTKESKAILASFERNKEILKENPQFGNPIRKQLIPKELKKLEITNLYRVELANYWRMLYTVEGDSNNIFVIILRIIDHKEYDRLFGYKKK